MRTIIVGVDGSSGSAAALKWAVHEARVHDCEVRAVRAWSWIDQTPPDVGTFDPHYDEEAARRDLHAAVSAAVDDAPVAEVVVCDLPVAALRDNAVGADLLVVGARGSGGFAGLRLGSVSDRLLELAPCPVTIIREGVVERDGPVAVGIDGSAASLAALDWAVEEAKARNAELEILHGWMLPAAASSPYVGIPGLEEFEITAKAVINGAVARAAKHGVVAEGHLRPGGGAAFLLENAESAGLLVVGSRGHGRLVGALLGSTSRQVAHHASCPVVVVRA